MFGISTLRTVTNAAFERRRRRQAFQILNGLSPELKKDIGWPAAATVNDTPHSHSRRYLRN
ncbi:MAG: hypothetical protein H6891_07210 [Brucellaceae bacterium]|nr:hypothetical protein [Brucellaceae bacterium]